MGEQAEGEAGLTVHDGVHGGKDVGFLGVRDEGADVGFGDFAAGGVEGEFFELAVKGPEVAANELGDGLYGRGGDGGAFAFGGAFDPLVEAGAGGGGLFVNLAAGGEGAEEGVAVGNIAVDEDQQGAVGQPGDGVGELGPAVAGGGLAAAGAAAAAATATAAVGGATVGGVFLGGEGAFQLHQSDGVEEGEGVADGQGCVGLGGGGDESVAVGVHQVAGAGVVLEAAQGGADEEGIAVEDVGRHRAARFRRAGGLVFHQFGEYAEHGAGVDECDGSRQAVAGFVVNEG